MLTSMVVFFLLLFFNYIIWFCSDFLCTSCSLLRDRSRRPEGGWMGADQNFFKIWIVGLYPENHPSPQAFWPKFGIAMEKLNQHKKASNERAKPRSKSEANRKNCRTDLPGPVWPVHWTGLNGLGYSKTSRPVWLVLTTGLTGGTQKTPENLDSNDESQPNDHENRWNLGDYFASTPWTYLQEILS